MIKFKFAADIFEDSDEFFGFKYDKRNQLRFLLPKFITPKKEMTPIESFKLLSIYSNVVKKYYFKNYLVSILFYLLFHLYMGWGIRPGKY